jgi:hypothetical protein
MNLPLLSLNKIIRLRFLPNLVSLGYDNEK